MDKNKVKIPRLMRNLPKDSRGYPVPVTAFRDKNGKPHFAVNDSAVRTDIIIHDRCPICGNKLSERLWFVGGPLSAFNPDGAYIDPAMHYECMKYALQVCPYLAAPSYTRRIDDKTIKPDTIPDAVVFVDSTMIPERPDVFVAVETNSYSMSLHTPPMIYLKPRRPYSSIEFWKNGQRLRPPPGGFNGVIRSHLDRSLSPRHQNY
jgi:hypothetical protein